LVPIAAVAQNNMFPNYYGSYNPATAGLLYRQDAALTTALQRSGQNTQLNYYGNVNARISAIHGGLGVSFERSQYNRNFSDQLNLNYSYHMRLGENTVLAAGASVGLVGMNVVSAPGNR
jgi:hypothetical protein